MYTKKSSTLLFAVMMTVNGVALAADSTATAMTKSYCELCKGEGRAEAEASCKGKTVTCPAPKPPAPPKFWVKPNGYFLTVVRGYSEYMTFTTGPDKTDSVMMFAGTTDCKGTHVTMQAVTSGNKAELKLEADAEGPGGECSLTVVPTVLGSKLPMITIHVNIATGEVVEEAEETPSPSRPFHFNLGLNGLAGYFSDGGGYGIEASAGLSKPINDTMAFELIGRLGFVGLHTAHMGGNTYGRLGFGVDAMLRLNPTFALGAVWDGAMLFDLQKRTYDAVGLKVAFYPNLNQSHSLYFSGSLEYVGWTAKGDAVPPGMVAILGLGWRFKL